LKLPADPADGRIEAEIDLELPTDLASVEAQIEKSTGASVFSQSYSPTTRGRGGLCNLRLQQAMTNHQ